MRVLITRPRNDAEEIAEALKGAGAQVFFLPAIAIQPLDDPSALDRALSSLDRYHWLVLTSANAVKVLLERMAALRLEHLPPALKVAAVGPKTAAHLTAGGILPDFVPGEYTGEAILPGLGDLHGRWVLLPTADIAHDTLPRLIQAADGIAHVVTAYQTLPAEPDPSGLSALQEGLDWITFASGSAARNLVPMLQQVGLDPFHLPGAPRVACIGPKTAQAARQVGWQVDLVAADYTSEGLAQAILTQTSKRASL
jgi:uroporphyrinogen III methyltransferase / synthase